jgi:hypothetical protein
LGADAIALIKAILTLSDSGVGVDTILASNLLTILDSGVGVDAVAIKYLINILDSGLGQDAVSILAKISIQDWGVAADILIGEKFYKMIKEDLEVEEARLISAKTYSSGVDIIDRILRKVWTTISKVSTVWQETKK